MARPWALVATLRVRATHREQAPSGASSGGTLCLLWDRELCDQWEGAGLASQQDHSPHPGASGASWWLRWAQQGEGAPPRPSGDSLRAAGPGQGT